MSYCRRFLGLALLIAAFATSAQASINIEYSVDGADWHPIGGLDFVKLHPNNNGSVTFSPGGGTETGKLNDLSWILTAIAWDDEGTLDREITVTLAADSRLVSQKMTLDVSYFCFGEKQVLDIAASSPVHFDWISDGCQYDLTVQANPLRLERNLLFADAVCRTIDGTFTLTCTPVPEPTTLIAGALLLLPFAASTRRFLRHRRR